MWDWLSRLLPCEDDGAAPWARSLAPCVALGDAGMLLDWPQGCCLGLHPQRLWGWWTGVSRVAGGGLN